jgi:glycosyltransferase involved in cell wall biosynthesis
MIDLRMYRMSGIGRYLQTLMPGAIPRLKAKRIRILGNPEDLAHETWANDERIEFHQYRAPIFSIAEQVEGSRRGRSADLLWVPQYNIPLLYRKRLVVTIHDICQLAYPELLRNNLQRWYARYLLSAVARRADAILCDSEFTSNEVRKYLDVDTSRLFVVYPGIDFAPAGLHNNQNLRGGKDYLLAVGNVKKHKNLLALITAFGSIRNRIHHDLMIVGKQEGFLNAESALVNASVLMDGRVRFTGHVSDTELLDYYRNATALIFPSYYEGFGFPILEAMAQGCPVACSRAASLPEVAGEAALYFDPFDVNSIAEALLSIVTDTNLRLRLVNAGLKQKEKFRASICAEKTTEVINAFL